MIISLHNQLCHLHTSAAVQTTIAKLQEEVSRRIEEAGNASDKARQLAHQVQILEAEKATLKTAEERKSKEATDNYHAR